MPPLGLLPNQPAGSPDIVSYGYGGGMTPTRTATYTGAGSTSAQQRDLENYLKEQKRQNDRDYSLKKKDLDRQYEIAKQNARTSRERNQIEKWYNEQQVRLAGERLAQENRHFELDLEFRKQVHADELGLNQARLGYDVLGMQAQLRGPENYYQAAELARGVAAQPGTATFLNALQNNAKLAAYQAPAGIPDKVSVNSLSAKLGGPSIIPGTGTAAQGEVRPGAQVVPTNDDDNLAAIRNLASAGAHKLGAGSLERLTDTEMKLLQSGLGYVGVDVPTFMNQYARSRIGQSSGGGYRAA